MRVRRGRRACNPLHGDRGDLDELGAQGDGVRLCERLGDLFGEDVLPRQQRLAIGPDATSALDAFGQNSE